MSNILKYFWSYQLYIYYVEIPNNLGIPLESVSVNNLPKMDLFIKVLRILLLFATVFMTLIVCDEDVPVFDENMVQIDRKVLFNAPVFCPSNYRVDSQGRCRRLEY